MENNTLYPFVDHSIPDLQNEIDSLVLQKSGCVKIYKDLVHGVIYDNLSAESDDVRDKINAAFLESKKIEKTIKAKQLLLDDLIQKDKEVSLKFVWNQLYAVNLCNLQIEQIILYWAFYRKYYSLRGDDINDLLFYLNPLLKTMDYCATKVSIEIIWNDFLKGFFFKNLI